MKEQPTGRGDRETAFIAQLAACISFVSFFFCFQHGDVLLYGDAVAHINIARRVFDSLTPGLLQLGTVWLPLPHLLMIPFLLSDSLWQSGMGGSIPSMVAYVLGTAGMFRLVRATLSFHSAADIATRIAAWSAAIIYAVNPNLIYLQTTAMTEPVYLALFIWATVYFTEFAREMIRDDPDANNATSSLVKCGFCLAGACLTRYDGWFLAAVMCVVALAIAWGIKPREKALRGALAKFVLLVVAAPTLWLAYNAIVYRNPLEFANGPYSARAIEQANASRGVPPHPGLHDVPVAFSYFLKSAELNMAEGNWQKFWVALLFAGSAIVLMFERRFWPLMLLWAPLPFYMLSVAYGGVPIFLPAWWPFSYYNTRYGIELLPAFAVFAAVMIHFLLGFARNRNAKMAVVFGMLILLVGSYTSVWRAQPVCFREAWINSRTRIALESELAADFKRLPKGSNLLMYLGDHVGALQRAGIPLRQVINEGNHRPWKEPSDPEGLWEHALADPARYVEFVVALEGDPVALGIAKRDLHSLVVIHTSGQPTATIYSTHRFQR